MTTFGTHVLPANSLRVAAVQMESQAGDKDANFGKIEAFVAQAAAQGVELIVFPECCITGYWFIRNLTPPQLENLAEPIPDGATTRRLKALAAHYNIGIGAGLVEKAKPGFTTVTSWRSLMGRYIVTAKSRRSSIR